MKISNLFKNAFSSTAQQTKPHISTLEDYAKTIFLNKYGHGKPIVQDSEYPRYFLYEFKISHPATYHKQLIDDGFLQIADFSDTLNSCTVSELKQLAEILGQSKSGTKKILFNRITNSASNNTILSLINKPTVFSLSEKGKQYIKQNEDLIFLFKHQNWNIDFDEYIVEKKKSNDKEDFHNIFWNIFNDKIHSCYKDRKWLSLPSIYSCMAELSLEEQNKNKALFYYIKAIHIEVNGLQNESCVYLYAKGYYTEKELQQHYIKPYLTLTLSKIIKLKDYFKESMLLEIIKQDSSNYYIIHLCTDELFQNFINDIIYNKNFDEDKWQTVLKNNFIQSIPKFKAYQYD